MKAEPARQWRLLDLAELDTRLDQIAHRLRSSDEQRAVVADIPSIVLVIVNEP